MTMAKQTTDHDAIRHWIESRDGRPSRVKGAAKDGILRVDFGEKEDNLEEIDWDQFFKIFEGSKLAFLHQDKVGDGKTSRFHKFIDRH